MKIGPALWCGLALTLTLLGCKDQDKVPVVDANDLVSFLQPTSWTKVKQAKQEVAFWSARLDVDSSGLGDLTPLANAYTRLFERTGEYAHLRAAERLLSRAYSIAARSRDGHGRNLAHNLITQHRFREAEVLLDTIYSKPHDQNGTELMRFDVYLERGKVDSAYANLSRIKDLGDLNYLLRLARWMDQQGDLDAATARMEKVKRVVDSRNLPGLKAWAYPNLADFYSHAGRLTEAYALYLQTLALESDNPHAWKGIAWLAYSADGDSSLATTILDSLESQYRSPSNTLLRLDMARHQGDMDRVRSLESLFLEQSGESESGGLYRMDRAYVLMDGSPALSLELALQEWENRKTPATAALLSHALFSNDRQEEALELLRSYRNKTEEPLVLLRMAEVFAAMDMEDEVAALKDQLSDAAYELGPHRYELLMAL
jgi:tetratricopeptide (TPR) repeat protein